MSESLIPQVEAALRAQDFTRARELAERAIADGESALVLWTLRGRWRWNQGRPLESAADFEKALQIKPGDPALLTWLARSWSESGRFNRAVSAAREAIAAAPGSADALHILAFASEQLGELDVARDAFEAVLRAEPGHPDATARLAGLAARRGDWAGARALAARIPNHAAARFAVIMADLAEHQFAAAEANAREIAGSTKVPPQILGTALTFLADALDAQDRIAEAFDAYEQANTTLRTASRQRFGRPGIETGHQIAARLTAELEAVVSWPAPDAEPQSARRHVFVLGFPRSGTTLLAEILAGHPGAAVLDETPVLRDAIAEFSARPGGLARLAATPADEVAHWRALYWRRVSEAGAEGDLVVDKVPLNTLHLPLIARLFPHAKIVFALRDPRDAVFGCFRRQFALNTYTWEFTALDSAAAFYDSVMRFAELCRARLPLDMLDLRNETLAADPDGEVRRLCDFLHIAPHAAMTDFASRKKRRAIASPDAARLADGIRATSAPWRRYGRELAPLQPRLEPWIRRFGYPHE